MQHFNKCDDTAVASPSSKISNLQDASFLCPSAVLSCSSAMMGKIKY
jgi:hypothetical protein